MDGLISKQVIYVGVNSRKCRGTIPAVERVIQRQFAQLVRKQQCVTQRQTRMLGQAEQEIEIQVLIALQLHLPHQRLRQEKGEGGAGQVMVKRREKSEQRDQYGQRLRSDRIFVLSVFDYFSGV
jgi:hypothetical protein